MTITKYKATEGRMVYGERASVYFVQKKIEKKNEQEKYGKLQNAVEK